MSIANYFPIWDKLTESQQTRIAELADFRKVPAGKVLHDGGPNCLGLVLVRSGQLRAYMLSEEAERSPSAVSLKWIFAFSPHPALCRISRRM